ncbi:MAG: aminomethyl-transferring glycine dehydrogenase subunit GcvPA [Coriobacteriia bacterium]
MLDVVGARSVDDVFSVIPDEVRLRRPLDLPGGMSEVELAAHLEELSARTAHAGSLVSFAGAGSYDHHIPAIVDAVVSKPAFFTAYTPYQPEVSQGTLQAIYEYQSMVCQLTGMDVSNASLYDGATSLVEAALMATRATKRGRVVVSAGIHPEWRETLATYAVATGMELLECPTADGRTDPARLAELLGEDVAAVCVAQVNVYGVVEDVAAVAEMAHATGALAVVAADPILLGVLEAPGALGADVVVAEGQSLGSPQSFGGPGLGIFACRDRFIRQMPGRVVGRTVDVDGRPGFVLTMATREQHIRREKATSNICSNHALNALAAGVYLNAVGSAGLRGIGRSCVAKAHYLRDELLKTGRFSAPWDAPFAREFALRFEDDAEEFVRAMVGRGFLAGVPLERIATRRPDPGVDAAGVVLFALTEKRTRAQMDRFVEAVVSL